MAVQRTPNLGVFTTRQLLSEGYPLKLVTHDEGGDWLADLPIGWRAWREDGFWSRERRPSGD